METRAVTSCLIQGGLESSTPLWVGTAGLVCFAACVTLVIMVVGSSQAIEVPRNFLRSHDKELNINITRNTALSKDVCSRDPTDQHFYVFRSPSTD